MGQERQEKRCGNGVVRALVRRFRLRSKLGCVCVQLPSFPAAPLPSDFPVLVAWPLLPQHHPLPLHQVSVSRFPFNTISFHSSIIVATHHDSVIAPICSCDSSSIANIFS